MRTKVDAPESIWCRLQIQNVTAIHSVSGNMLTDVQI